jgi:hypothetical protein
MNRMKKTFQMILLVMLTPAAMHAQRVYKIRTLQAHTGAGISNSLTLSTSVGMLFNKNHGARLSYFTQKKENWYLFGSNEKVYDAINAFSTLYQYRVNAAENFDVTLAVGPALVLPTYEGYLKPGVGEIYHLSLNLWTNKQKPNWAGMGFWAGCGYIRSNQVKRVYGETGIAVRLGY